MERKHFITAVLMGIIGVLLHTTVFALQETFVEPDTILANPPLNVEIVITLPTGTTGRKIIVKKSNDTNGIVRVNPGTGITIDGASEIQTNVPYQGWILQFDGTDWWIVGHI